MRTPVKVIVVTGPTACGKTQLAVRLAGAFKGEVVSADSRQVYQHLDLGSGKDLEEYGDVPHHLIDIVPPTGCYDLKNFCTDAPAAIRNIASRGKTPIVCGGTALYLHALIKGYSLPGEAPDPDLRRRLDASTLEELQLELARLAPGFYGNFADRGNFNRVRRALEIALSGHDPAAALSVPSGEFEFLVLGVLYPREEVRRRIEERLDARLNAGLVEEVASLHDRHRVSWEKLEFLGLEYRRVAEFLQGKTGFEQMRKLLLDNIRQFAKRQDVFFRKMEREGVAIHWVERGDFEIAAALAARFLAGSPLPEPEFKLMEFKNPDLSKLGGRGSKSAT